MRRKRGRGGEVWAEEGEEDGGSGREGGRKDEMDLLSTCEVSLDSPATHLYFFASFSPNDPFSFPLSPLLPTPSSPLSLFPQLKCQNKPLVYDVVEEKFRIRKQKVQSILVSPKQKTLRKWDWSGAKSENQGKSYHYQDNSPSMATDRDRKSTEKTYRSALILCPFSPFVVVS